MIFSVCNIKGHLHIQRSVQSSVRLRFRDALRLDWDGRGRVLLKVKTIVQMSKCLVHMGKRTTTPLTPSLFLSWDRDGRGRLAVSVVTTMVTKVTTSCPALAWLRRTLRLSVSCGGSTEIAKVATNTRQTHMRLTPKEVELQIEF